MTELQDNILIDPLIIVQAIGSQKKNLSILIHGDLSYIASKISSWYLNTLYYVHMKLLGMSDEDY